MVLHIYLIIKSSYDSDIEDEKTRQNVLQGVENYDKASLKPAETLEKIVLPAKEGTIRLNVS